MVVLDSSFLVDIIQKDPAAIEKLKELERNDEMICTTVINILELYWSISLITRREKLTSG